MRCSFFCILWIANPYKKLQRIADPPQQVHNNVNIFYVIYFLFALTNVGGADFHLERFAVLEYAVEFNKHFSRAIIFTGDF